MPRARTNPRGEEVSAVQVKEWRKVMDLHWRLAMEKPEGVEEVTGILMPIYL